VPLDESPISVVIVTHDHADQVIEVLETLRPQLEMADEVIVVDNASADGTAEVARQALPQAQVIETGVNLGFSAGSNLGVARTSAPLVLLLNPDCHLQPGCLHELRRCAADHGEWGAWQATVLLGDGSHVNTAGNVVHFLGIGWAGGLGEPVEALGSEPREVAFGSGAALVVRREAWEQVGGLEDRFFMYCEDLDLCLRLRLRGWKTGVAPRARVVHDYTFEKGEYKWYFLERNRWWTILGTYPSAVFVAVLPALLLFELLLLPVAAAGGWLQAKRRAQGAVLRELPAILARRRRIQAARQISAADFARTLVATVDSPMLASARRVPGLAQALAFYWWIVTRTLR
jgi:N-acetylglucosaminyl-diphospho-decaprenol L-rhamnosyltransferase